ncbi:MAG: hypothetical protein RLZZ422_1503 [Pseudomonadota bacterium]
MSEVITFTQKRLSLLEVPTSKRVTYRDKTLQGFQLVIYPSGVKSFYVYKRIGKQPERVFIGNWPLMDVEEARRKAQEILGKIASGEFVLPKQVVACPVPAPVMSFGELFAKYLELHAKPRKKTWAEDERQYRVYLQHWAKRPIDGITKLEVTELHQTLGDKHGHYQANRVLALLKSMFEKARDWDLLLGSNPCSATEKFEEVARERFLQSDELVRFFRALNDESNTTIRDYFLMLLFTGVRRTAVLKMRWDEINWLDKTWSIKPENAKSGKSQIVPLVSTAYELLQVRRQNVEGEWVFPARLGAKQGHLTEPKRGWDRLLKRAQLEDLRLHDLRRSMGSWQAKKGYSLVTIGKTLHHSSPASTAVYARLDIETVREAMEDTIETMLKLSKIKSPS